MPQLIKDTNFKLTDSKYNLELSAKLIQSPHTVLEDTLEYKIFVTGEENGHIGLYNKSSQMLDYMVKYRSSKKFVGTSVTQIALWRRWDSPWVQGVTTRMFFDYLLGNWPTIMSDGQQTQDGQRFWVSKMAQATALGHRVGLVDMNVNEIKWFQGTPNEFSHWLSQHNAWAKDLKNSFVRYLIAI